MIQKAFDSQYGVSAVLSYLFSFLMLSSVMVGAILTTNSLIDDKTYDVAAIQAQRVVDLVSDALIEADTITRVLPDSEYTHELLVPDNLGGKEYIIELSNTTVYVNVSGSAISKHSVQYDFSDYNVHLDKSIRGGSESLHISYTPPSERWKIDFGTGNSKKHSAVDAGYYMSVETTGVTGFDPEWDFDEYRYRQPILINFTIPSEKIGSVTPKVNFWTVIPIVLTPEIFNYDAAKVVFWDDNTNQPIYDTYSEPVAKADFKFVWRGALGQNPGPYIGVPPSLFSIPTRHSVEYWNPNGTSLIYLRVPFVLPSELYHETLLMMYYGYEGVSKAEDLGDAFRCCFSDVAVSKDDFDPWGHDPLYDDFNGSSLTDTDGIQWELNAKMKNNEDVIPSCVNFTEGRYITSSELLMPPREPKNVHVISMDESKIPPIEYDYCYIYEMKMKLIYGNASSIILAEDEDLSDDTTDYTTESYILSISRNASYSNPGLWLNNFNNSVPPLPDFYEDLGNIAEPTLHDWIRVRTFFYNRTIKDPPNPAVKKAYFNNYIFDYDTFAPFENNLSVIDNDFDTPPRTIFNPSGKLKFGIGGGLNPHSNPTDETKVYVDWVRLLKISPLYVPKVSVGAWECRDWKWPPWTKATQGHTRRGEYSTPFNPTASLRDYMSGNPTTYFGLGELPAGSYRIILQKGDPDNAAGAFNVAINKTGDVDLVNVTIPATIKGEIVEEELLFNLDTDTELCLKFTSNPWMINSCIIERDYHGITLQ